MSRARYGIKNGDRILGVLWENEKLGKVFVAYEDIDLNFDLEIFDIDTDQDVKNVDLRDFILEVLPKEE